MCVRYTARATIVEGDWRGRGAWIKMEEAAGEGWKDQEGDRVNRRMLQGDGGRRREMGGVVCVY